MAEFGKKLLVLILGSLAVKGISTAIVNKMDGKDILGRPKAEQEKTRVDWKGNVHLGSTEYQVV